MTITRLGSGNGFVVTDLGADVASVGAVRLAPKILQSGAKWLARSQTYQCAALEMKVAGASVGLNATAENREQVVAGFVAEVSSDVDQGRLMFDPAKGVTYADLEPLTALDNREGARLAKVGGVSRRVHMLAVGAVACADSVAGIEGKSVAIERFDDVGYAIASQVTARGGKVTAVGSASGSATKADGFDVEALRDAWIESEEAMLETLGIDTAEPVDVLAADVDVLFVGSKMGVISHTNTDSLRARVVVPCGSIPYTTKAVLMMQAQDTIVLPDFLCTAGAVMADFESEFADPDATGDAFDSLISERLGSAIANHAGSERGAILDACLSAESFLSSWVEELPFGRPFA